MAHEPIEDCNSMIVAHLFGQEYVLTGYDTNTNTQRWTPRMLAESGKKRKATSLNDPRWYLVSTTHYPNDDTKYAPLMFTEECAADIARHPDFQNIGEGSIHIVTLTPEVAL